MPLPIIPLTLNAAQLVTGLVNKGKAKKTAKELAASRPDYEINPSYQQDVDLAESELAGGGLSSRAETAYNNLNNQQFSSSLDSILKGDGSVNNIADVFGADQEGRARLALLTDQVRVGQIDRLMKTRQSLADQTDKAFEFNEVRPWMDRAQAAGEARKGADSQIWSGLEGLGSTGMQYLDERNQDKQFQQYLQTLSGGGSGYNSPTVTNRGTIDYTNPDLSTGGSPTPRNQPSSQNPTDEMVYANPWDNPMFWFRKL